MRLALGTVQFGLDYGVSNQSGRTPLAEAGAILNAARRHNIDILDTAAAYGCAEEALQTLDARGRGFRVITKTARLANGLGQVVARARLSAERLGRPLHGIMVHAARDLLLPEGPALWRALQDLVAEGVAMRLGISAYASDPVGEIARRFRPSLMQLPVSVIDQRLWRDGTLDALAGQGIEIHARSLFHQGLIFADPDRLPGRLAGKRAEVAKAQARIAACQAPALVVALSFAASIPAIAVAVVGVTNQAELEGIAAAAAMPVGNIDFSILAADDPLILDPTQW